MAGVNKLKITDEIDNTNAKPKSIKEKNLFYQSVTMSTEICMAFTNSIINAREWNISSVSRESQSAFKNALGHRFPLTAK